MLVDYLIFHVLFIFFFQLERYIYHKKFAQLKEFLYISFCVVVHAVANLTFVGSMPFWLSCICLISALCYGCLIMFDTKIVSK